MSTPVTLEDLDKLQKDIAEFECWKTLQELEDDYRAHEQWMEQQAEKAWLAAAEYDPDPDFY